MRKEVWRVLLVLLLLGGCATTYTHPTKGPSDFEKDHAICERSAKKMLSAKGVT